MMKRAEIVVKGRVQRVGYKEKVDRAAVDHDLTGFVKNLEDGTVKIVCEGKKAEIEDLLEEIRIDKHPIKVSDIEVEYSDATGEFECFDIEREKDFERATYKRMDEAVDHLGELVKGVTKVGEKVEENIQETRAFREETVECFDRLDEKYHVVSENLVTTKEEMLESRKELSNLVKHIGVLARR